MKKKKTFKYTVITFWVAREDDTIGCLLEGVQTIHELGLGRFDLGNESWVRTDIQSRAAPIAQQKSTPKKGE